MWRASHTPTENGSAGVVSNTKHWKWCAWGWGKSGTGVAAVNSIAAWVDARPYRLKLVLLAHTVILVGAILLVATW